MSEPIFTLGTCCEDCPCIGLMQGSMVISVVALVEMSQDSSHVHKHGYYLIEVILCET